MWLVIADTGPVNYLILIGHIELLPALFEKVTLPAAVQSELASPLPYGIGRPILRPGWRCAMLLSANPMTHR